MFFIDFGVAADCKNHEQSSREICVKCNECGRFEKSAEKTEENGEERE